MDDRLMLGPLEDVAHDPHVTDVAVTCDGRVWVDRGNGMDEFHPHAAFRSPQTVRDYAVQLCAQLGRRLDDACPIADASTAGGIRVHAVIAPLVPQGAAISIRFPECGVPRLESLAVRGAMPKTWLPLLRGLVSRRATILITGGTGTGKTTLMKALLAECGASERIVTVEEVRELGMLGLANHVSLVSREANVEGAGAVGLAAGIAAAGAAHAAHLKAEDAAEGVVGIELKRRSQMIPAFLQKNNAYPTAYPKTPPKSRQRPAKRSKLIVNSLRPPFPRPGRHSRPWPRRPPPPPAPQGPPPGCPHRQSTAAAHPPRAGARPR